MREQLPNSNEKKELSGAGRQESNLEQISNKPEEFLAAVDNKLSEFTENNISIAVSCSDVENAENLLAIATESEEVLISATSEVDVILRTEKPPSQLSAEERQERKQVISQHMKKLIAERDFDVYNWQLASVSDFDNIPYDAASWVEGKDDDLLTDTRRLEIHQLYEEIIAEELANEPSEDVKTELKKLLKLKTDINAMLSEISQFPGNRLMQNALRFSTGELLHDYFPNTNSYYWTDVDYKRARLLRGNTIVSPNLITIDQLQTTLNHLNTLEKFDDRKDVKELLQQRIQLYRKDIEKPFDLNGFDDYIKQIHSEAVGEAVHGTDEKECASLLSGQNVDEILSSPLSIIHFRKMSRRLHFNQDQIIKLEELFKQREEQFNPAKNPFEPMIPSDPENLASRSKLMDTFFQKLTNSGILENPIEYVSLSRPQQAYIQNSIISEIVNNPEFQNLPVTMKAGIRDIELRLREDLLDKKKNFIPLVFGMPIRFVFSKDYVTQNKEHLNSMLGAESTLNTLIDSNARQDAGGYYMHNDRTILINEMEDTRSKKNILLHEISHAIDYSIMQYDRVLQGDYNMRINKVNSKRLDAVNPDDLKTISPSEGKEINATEQCLEMVMTETVARLREDTTYYSSIESIKKAILDSKLYFKEAKFDIIRDKILPDLDSFFLLLDQIDPLDVNQRGALATYLSSVPFSQVTKHFPMLLKAIGKI